MKLTVEEINSNKVGATLEKSNNGVSQIFYKTMGVATSTDNELYEQLEEKGYYSEEFLNVVAEDFNGGYLTMNLFRLMKLE